MSDKALQIVEKRREVKGRGQRERYTQLIAEVQRIARKDQKVLSEQCKEMEENNRIGKIKISSRKLEIPREHFTQGWE